MNTRKQHDDFQTVWIRRKQQWQREVEKTLPDDDTLLRLAEIARQRAPKQAAVVLPFAPHRKRWIPYAAAACLLVGVAAIALTHHTSGPQPLPEWVTVEDQTVQFLCNHDCSVQDVMVAINDVITK